MLLWLIFWLILFFPQENNSVNSIANQLFSNYWAVITKFTLTQFGGCAVESVHYVPSASTGRSQLAAFPFLKTTYVIVSLMKLKRLSIYITFYYFVGSTLLSQIFLMLTSVMFILVCRSNLKISKFC